MQASAGRTSGEPWVPLPSTDDEIAIDVHPRRTSMAAHQAVAAVGDLIIPGGLAGATALSLAVAFATRAAVRTV